MQSSKRLLHLLLLLLVLVFVFVLSHDCSEWAKFDTSNPPSALCTLNGWSVKGACRRRELCR